MTLCSCVSHMVSRCERNPFLSRSTMTLTKSYCLPNQCAWKLSQIQLGAVRERRAWSGGLRALDPFSFTDTPMPGSLPGEIINCPPSGSPRIHPLSNRSNRLESQFLLGVKAYKWGKRNAVSEESIGQNDCETKTRDSSSCCHSLTWVLKT